MSVRHGPWPVDGQLPATRPNALGPFNSFSPAKWHGVEPPPYDWMVDGCFLRGTVAMLSGDGGLGKSLLMQQLCTAATIGKPWLGLETQACKAFAFFCEDDEGELHRRQHAINRLYDCQGADLEHVEYAARVGMENVLVEFDRRTDQPKFMPLFEQLRHKVTSIGAQIVVLDTLADVFAGNEIIRNQVRRFVSALRRLAMEIQGVIVMTAHPSLTGMSSGTGLSGSTGWNNSVRSRLYLTRVRQNGDEEEEDTNERYLKTMKNNQGPFGGKIKLRWEKGVFVRADQAAPAPDDLVSRLDLDNRLIAALTTLVENGSMVHAAQESRSSFSSLIRAMPEFRSYSHGAIMSAQERMIASGRIARVEMGPASKRRKYIRPLSARYPGEVA